jgi:hypothetical protein
VGERRGAYRMYVEKRKDKIPLGRPFLDGRMMLKWVLKKWYGAWSGLIWPR